MHGSMRAKNGESVRWVFEHLDEDESNSGHVWNVKCTQAPLWSQVLKWFW